LIKKIVQAIATSVVLPPLNSYFKIFIYTYENYKQISHYIYILGINKSSELP